MQGLAIHSTVAAKTAVTSAPTTDSDGKPIPEGYRASVISDLVLDLSLTSGLALFRFIVWGWVENGLDDGFWVPVFHSPAVQIDDDGKYRIPFEGLTKYSRVEVQLIEISGTGATATAYVILSPSNFAVQGAKPQLYEPRTLTMLDGSSADNMGSAYDTGAAIGPMIDLEDGVISALQIWSETTTTHVGALNLRVSLDGTHWVDYVFEDGTTEITVVSGTAIAALVDALTGVCKAQFYYTRSSGDGRLSILAKLKRRRSI